jgi:geranyl-CoA carboxylase beta subunit
MTALRSLIDTRSDAFRRNAERMAERLAQVQGLQGKVVAESASKREKFEKKGQLLPRERVARLLDRGSSFLELSALAGLGMHDDDGKKAVLGGGSIVGIGQVAGKRVLISASDSAVKGGTVAPMGLKKGLRAQAIALQNKLPLICAGGVGRCQPDVPGRYFCRWRAQLCQPGTPVGRRYSANRRGAWVIDGRRRLPARPVGLRGAGERPLQHLPGRPTAGQSCHWRGRDRRGTGRQRDARQRDRPGRIPGRERCPRHRAGARSDGPPALGRSRRPDATARAPLYDAAELLGIVPADEREPYDTREIIARIVDGSHFLEFKASFDRDTLCGHARIDGHRVGIIANNGPIQPTGSVKAAQFIQLCDQSGTPLVFLQNTTGYMVGTAAERAGAIKHGSKMIQAVANARVPKFTIVVGGSFGAGNYGMCGRGFDPNFIFTWPTARTAVMGGAQAAMVMEMLSRGKLERAGVPMNEQAEAGIQAMSDQLKRRLDAESDVLFGTARLWDDGIIDPRDTRSVLAQCLAMARDARARVLHPNTFGVARF